MLFKVITFKKSFGVENELKAYVVGFYGRHHSIVFKWC